MKANETRYHFVYVVFPRGECDMDGFWIVLGLYGIRYDYKE